MIRAFYLGLIAALLLACAPLTKPNSFEQTLAYAQGALTGTVQTCTDLILRARMSKESGQKCLDQSVEAKRLLDLARASGGTEGATSLEQARAILLQLDMLLQENTK